MAASMQTMLSVLSPDLLKGSASSGEYGHYVDILREHQLFSVEKSASLQTVISHINTCLNGAKYRVDGLVLLHTLLEQCTSDVFVENAATWSRLLLQTLQSYDPAVVLQFCCRVTSSLLRTSITFAELSREFSTSLLPQLITALLAAKTQWQPAAMECLCLCMKCYSGPCGPFRIKIEKFLIQSFDTNLHKTQEVVCRCLSLLPRCGGGGNLGVKHTENWTEQSRKLLGSLHAHLDVLYQDVETGMESEDVPDARLDLNLLPEDENEGIQIATKRFSMLCLCLEKLLLEPFPAVAKVPINAVINLVCRTLAVTGKQLLARPSSERVIKASVLPSLHTSSLKLLSALILCCKSLLVTHVSVINKLLLQTLNWTFSTGNMYGKTRPFSHLREQVYATLCDWLRVMGAMSEVAMVMGDLLVHIKKDIQPEENSMKLETKNGGTASHTEAPSKKKKKTSQQYLGQGLSGQKLNSCANYPVCRQALQVLRHVIHSEGDVMKSRYCKDIQEAVIPILLEVQQRPHGPPIPYQDAECRHGLYHALLACVLVPHPQWPPPTHVAIRILSAGQRDEDIEVSNFCRESLTMCRVIIHPRAPTLNTPVLLAEGLANRKAEETSAQSYSGMRESLFSNRASGWNTSHNDDDKKKDVDADNIPSQEGIKEVGINKELSSEVERKQDSEESGDDHEDDKVDDDSIEGDNDDDDNDEDDDDDEGLEKRVEGDNDSTLPETSEGGSPESTVLPPGDSAVAPSINDTKSLAVKRSLEEDSGESSQAKKEKMDVADEMLTAFVDAGPDSD